MCRVRGLEVGSVWCGYCGGGIYGFVVWRGVVEWVPGVLVLWDREVGWYLHMVLSLVESSV